MDVNKPVTNRILYLVALAWTLVMAGCSSSRNQIVERMVSKDNQFWATVSVNRGSALDHDWHGVAIGEVRPTWTDVVLRRTSEGICSLQGPGSIAVSWTGPRELTVTCTHCKQQDLYVYDREWRGVLIKYQGVLGSELTGPEGPGAMKR